MTSNFPQSNFNLSSTTLVMPLETIPLSAHLLTIEDRNWLYIFYFKKRKSNSRPQCSDGESMISDVILLADVIEHSSI